MSRFGFIFSRDLFVSWPKIIGAVILLLILTNILPKSLRPFQKYISSYVKVSSSIGSWLPFISTVALVVRIKLGSDKDKKKPISTSGETQKQGHNFEIKWWIYGWGGFSATCCQCQCHFYRRPLVGEVILTRAEEEVVVV